MFLKRIRLSGFKSFADGVDFEFGPGVTCIVGPNGCGKSNVLDAFKWVLGTQSARSLRGRQMSDMIFNGSSARRSSSVAHVDLVFDNADHSLPCDHEEVVVTRKLYRSGESEYLVNSQTSRLKDIRELFMDTGVGVEAYSVVEQGRVDSLLQSSPVDRRTIFEEAAGISKYKARRREAERKLERTDQNLLRVADIVAELEKRLRSVKLQAGKARTYRQHEARLSELRSSYAMAEYHRFTCQLDQLAAEVQRRTDEVTGAKADISRCEAQESELAARLDRLNEQINQADAVFVQAKSERLAQEERIEAALQRAEEQRGHLDQARGREQAAVARLEQGQAELSTATASLESLRDRAEEWTQRIDDLSQRDQTLAGELAVAQSELEDEKAGIIELLRKSAQARNEMIRLNTHRESLLDRQGRLSQRDTQIAADLRRAMDEQTRLRKELEEFEALKTDQSRTLDDKAADVDRLRGLRQELLDEVGRAKEHRSAIQSRRELLEELHRKMEGVGAAARGLLDRKAHGDAEGLLDGVVGLVADVLDVAVDDAPVVDAALGDLAQHVIARESRLLIDEPKALGGLPGRLSVICLDSLPPVVTARDFSAMDGFVARAIDLVSYPDEFEQLVRHMLGRTIVVDSLRTALAMSSSDVEGHRFVTVRGEVVEVDKRVRLGSLSAGEGLISRKSELRALGVQAKEVDARIATLEDRLHRTAAEIGHVESVMRELEAARLTSATSLAQTNAALDAVKETIQRFAQEQPLIAHEVSLIEEQIAAVHRESEESGRSLESIGRENAASEARVQQHQERIDDMVSQRGELQEALTEAKVGLGQVSEKRGAVEETIAGIRRTLEELDRAISQARQEAAQCEASIEQSERVVSEGRDKLTEFAERIRDAERQGHELRRQREQQRDSSETLTSSLREARSRLEAAEVSLHEQQVAAAELGVRRNDLVARVSEELGVDLAERYAGYEHEEQDWQRVEAEIAELRRKMERLGNVNMDAIAELEELETRHDFLTGQRDDLVESKRQLLQLIERLNAESRERFQKTFVEVRDNFRTLFRKLFGGGRADIVLEESDDVLEAGIEILAQPPGKDLQTISLMSGGEKSLTAIALLMSIFKTRPAPFTILDEVDAALDEANNDRFNRIVQEFVADTQFIIITHSKWTMNMANHLYGVTMQEPGVSTRVSVEFSGVNVA